MIEFERIDGRRIWVNLAAVKLVEPLPEQVGCFLLVLEYFPAMTPPPNSQPTMMQHAITVKNETTESMREKLSIAIELGPRIDFGPSFTEVRE